MIYPIFREIERIKREYYDPNDSHWRLTYKDPTRCVRFHFGIVEDNKDPDKKGRLKLKFPQWGDNFISDWVSYARQFSGTKMGMFMLPEIGDQVICIFINDNPAKPIVIGSIYSKKIQPPIKKNKGNNLKIFTSKSGSKIILDDKDGEEKITILMHDGKMRMTLDPNKGVSIVNEEGDINIKCKKLIIESKDDTYFKTQKGITITSEQTLKLEAKKSVEVKSAVDAKFKGQKIAIRGQSGVTAKDKQVALKNDQVVGIDMHNIEVPTPSGTKTVPSVPHPYLGKLNDKCSTDVEVNNRAVAVKGSKSKYDTPGHIAMAPGVKFTSQPNNEGEVTSGTEPTVMVNNKEIAVLGAKVKTCNDPMPQETCSIISLGAAVVLPILMPGMDPEQFKIDGGTTFNTREPVVRVKSHEPKKDKKITNVKWDKTNAKVGEEITLEASLSNQYEGASVRFCIFKEGADTEKDTPIAKKFGNNKGGKAEAKIIFTEPRMDAEEDELKYIFETWSLNCGKKKSSSLTVEKVKPEFSNMKWLDESGQEVTKICIGKKIKLSADIKNLDDGVSIFAEIYKKDDEENIFDEVEGIISNGKAEIEWKVKYKEKHSTSEDENNKYVAPEYFFKVGCKKYNKKSDKSSNVELVDRIEYIFDESLNDKDVKLIFADDSTKDVTIKNNKIIEEEIPVGPVKIIIK